MQKNVFGNRENLKYHNKGNTNVFSCIDDYDKNILDIGCGSGDLCKLIKKKYSKVNYSGISCSPAEINQASKLMDKCYCQNLEADKPYQFLEATNIYDCLIFSHVLEHLSCPDEIISNFLPYLKNGGKIIIALPNVMFWKNRLQFILGKFEYQDYGIMDKTHLRFFTFYSAKKYLIDNNSNLCAEIHDAKGSFPLPILRQILNKIFLKSVCRKIDSIAIKLFPNFFGAEIVIVARKIE